MIFNRDYRSVMTRGKLLTRNAPDIDTVKPQTGFWIGLGVAIMALLILLMVSGCAHAHTITEEKAVRAELGEAENQGYDGMLAIACALRHRGSLRGVYGYKAIKLVNGHYYRGKRQIGYKAVQDAKTAWVESSQVDTVNGATGWGNEADLNKFCSQAWWNKCIVTARVGSHWFYREVRQ